MVVVLIKGMAIPLLENSSGWPSRPRQCPRSSGSSRWGRWEDWLWHPRLQPRSGNKTRTSVYSEPMSACQWQQHHERVERPAGLIPKASDLCPSSRPTLLTSCVKENPQNLSGLQLPHLISENDDAGLGSQVAYIHILAPLHVSLPLRKLPYFCHP